MQTRYEITGKYEELADCNSLLYAPLEQPLNYRRSRGYEFGFSGDSEAVTQFVGSCLLDEISQQLHVGDDAPWSDQAFILEYG
ncbi:MAG: hypothetical protein AAF585_21635, partial [Verrucomicrobiota bacterium]